jgi:hypothetical protein
LLSCHFSISQNSVKILCFSVILVPNEKDKNTLFCCHFSICQNVTKMLCFPVILVSAKIVAKIIVFAVILVPAKKEDFVIILNYKRYFLDIILVSAKR